MKTSAAIVAAALSASVSAVSTFAVVNHCAFDLYLWSVEGNQAPSQMFTLPANTPHIGYSEQYRYAGQYEGVSIKVAPYYMGNGDVPTYTLNVTQLEYTVPPPENHDPSIYYDLSMVNGNALMGVPFTYSPSNPGAVPQCKAGSCSGDYETCFAGYNAPHDDENTHACPFEQDIIFTFCDGNAQQPLIVPTGQVTVEQFAGKTCYDGGCLKKREIEVRQDESVCAPTVAGDDGVAVIAALCDEPVAPAASSSASSSSSSSSTSSSSSSSSSSTVAPAPTASAVAALQQPVSSAPAPTSTTSAAPVASSAAPAAAPVLSPLSALQLSSLANTGVTCWLSVNGNQNCGASKRDIHEHMHRHSHQAFHRRNRIIKSAA